MRTRVLLTRVFYLHEFLLTRVLLTRIWATQKSLSIDFCNSAHFALIKVNRNSMEIQFGHFEKIQELEVSFQNSRVCRHLGKSSGYPYLLESCLMPPLIKKPASPTNKNRAMLYTHPVGPRVC